MFVQYTATKGLKLYGDEAFCMSPPEITSPRNLLTNGDLKYGLYGWSVFSDATLTLEKGRLKVTTTHATNAGKIHQLVEVTSGVPCLIRARILGGSYNIAQIRIYDGTSLALIYNSNSVTVDDTTVGSWFTPTSDSVYVRIEVNGGAIGRSVYFSDLILCELEVKGVNAANLVTNSYFGTDTTGWTASNGGILTAPGGVLDIENGSATAGRGYTTFSVVSGRFYKIPFKFIYVDTNATVKIGTSINSTVYGLQTMSSSEEGYLVFRATATGTAYLTLSNNSSSVSLSSQWDNIICHECNAVVTNENFTAASVGWTTGGIWAIDIVNRWATITGGGSGDQLTQGATGWGQFVVGEHYTFTYKLTIPAEALMVVIRNVNLATDELSVQYTASGLYQVSFTAQDTDIELRFVSDSTVNTLKVEAVTGYLSTIDPVEANGGSHIDGLTGVSVSESNTSTGVLQGPAALPSPISTDIESGLSVRVIDAQQVGTGDWTLCGWLHAENNANFFYRKENITITGGSIRGGITSTGTMQFTVSDDGRATYDLVETSISVTGKWVFWELVRSGGTVFIRINSETASSVVTLVNAVGSLDTERGFNLVGYYYPFTVNTYSSYDAVRFTPSAVTRARSRTIYSSEKTNYIRDNKYSQLDSVVDLFVDQPTRIDSESQIIGNTVIADGGAFQETIVNRADLLLAASSKELDSFEVIEFIAFLDAVTRGGLFTYDAYASSIDNFINLYEVFLTSKNYKPSRQGALEYFTVSWAMRVRGTV